MNVPARCGKRGHSTGVNRISILTRTQELFLKAFFEGQKSEEPFYLSGGTALAAYYLNHRYSDDLDFFTRDRENLSAESHREQIERAAARSSLHLERSSRRGDHVQYFFSGDSHPEHPLEKVELVVDPPPYFGRPRNFEGVFVDDIVAIAVNKVTALSRREPKDYVDLYEIVRSGRCRPEDLVPHAIEKDPGLDHVVIAGDFRAVASLPNLMEFQRRYMVSPVDWDEVMRFYQGLADLLLAAFPPRRQE